MQFTLEKFVPASGAASRMFKFLNVFLNEFKIDEETINSYIDGVRQRFKSIYWRYRSFAFFKEVYEKLSSTIENFEDLDLDHKIIISFVFYYRLTILITLTSLRNFTIS
jgi:hypothetical protein